MDVEFAVRVWHSHIHLHNRCAEEPALLAALNKAPRFWIDKNFLALQTAIIFLGKIFDKKDVAHSVSKLLNAAGREIEYFNKNNLRDRKIQSGSNFDGLDEYLDNSHDAELGGS